MGALKFSFAMAIILANPLEEAIEAYRANDLDRAKTLAEVAKQEGYIGASTILGLIALEQGQDPMNALALFREAADEDDVEASYQAGRLLFAIGEKNRSIKDLRDAYAYISYAADQGHPEAQYRMGLLYDQGRFVEANSKEAIAWYRKAAEQGHRQAVYELAMIYIEGRRDLQPDFVEGRRWLEKASDLGIAAATFQLGVMYDLGQSVEPSRQKAFQWYRKAAQQGSANGMYNLAIFYARGIDGVEKDPLMAWVLSQRAVELGFRQERIAPVIKNLILSDEEKEKALRLLQDLRNKPEDVLSRLTYKTPDPG